MNDSQFKIILIFYWPSLLKQAVIAPYGCPHVKQKVSQSMTSDKTKDDKKVQCLMQEDFGSHGLLVRLQIFDALPTCDIGTGHTLL